MGYSTTTGTSGLMLRETVGPSGVALVNEFRYLWGVWGAATFRKKDGDHLHTVMLDSHGAIRNTEIRLPTY